MHFVFNNYFSCFNQVNYKSTANAESPNWDVLFVYLPNPLHIFVPFFLWVFVWFPREEILSPHSLSSVPSCAWEPSQFHLMMVLPFAALPWPSSPRRGIHLHPHFHFSLYGRWKICCFFSSSSFPLAKCGKRERLLSLNQPRSSGLMFCFLFLQQPRQGFYCTCRPCVATVTDHGNHVFHTYFFTGVAITGAPTGQDWNETVLSYFVRSAVRPTRCVSGFFLFFAIQHCRPVGWGICSYQLIGR